MHVHASRSAECLALLKQLPVYSLGFGNRFSAALYVICGRQSCSEPQGSCQASTHVRPSVHIFILLIPRLFHDAISSADITQRQIRRECGDDWTVAYFEVVSRHSLYRLRKITKHVTIYSSLAEVRKG